MENLKFSKCQNSDIKDIVVLVNNAYRNKNSNAWTSESHLLSGKRIDESRLEKILNKLDSHIYIVKSDDNILGCIQARLENKEIHIGLFAIDSKFQSAGIGKRLLEFAENESSKFWGIKSFVMEVISNRTELIEFYIRRGYINTNSYLDFPKSSLWEQIEDNLKLLVLKKEKND